MERLKNGVTNISSCTSVSTATQSLTNLSTSNLGKQVDIYGTIQGVPNGTILNTVMSKNWR
jgi:hypothetical protein